MNLVNVSAFLAAFERRYQADRVREHAILLDASGALVAERTGGRNRVDFTPSELLAARGGTVSHNHPLGRPLSADDLALGAEHGLTVHAFGTNAEGLPCHYRARFSVPSRAQADAIHGAFEAELARARTDLSVSAWTAEQYLQAARHLADTRLAERFGFVYERTVQERLSEATRHEQARLAALADVDVALRQQVFTPLAAGLARDLLHLARGGLVSLTMLEQVRRAISARVQRTMLGLPLQDGALAPYLVLHGEAQPRSVYFQVLDSLLRRAATVAVTRHADLLRRYLPADLVRSLEFATLSPFDTALAEDEAPQYDPLHLWLGPDGKRLSDRIWNAAGDMRAKLDAFLTEAIARRVPVDQMARDLEQFLLYGAGGYEALRLARNEVAQAGHRADALAAQGNPLVETYSPFVAPGHKCCDECDSQAANGPYPKDDLSHLPIFHVNCLCGVLWHVVGNVKAIVIRLRQQIEQAIGAAKRAFTDYIGPLSRKFVHLLFRGRS